MEVKEHMIETQSSSTPKKTKSLSTLSTPARKNPYRQFIESQSNLLAGKYPFLTSTQIRNKATKLWSQLTPEEKEQLALTPNLRYHTPRTPSSKRKFFTCQNDEHASNDLFNPVSTDADEISFKGASKTYGETNILHIHRPKTLQLPVPTASRQSILRKNDDKRKSACHVSFHIDNGNKVNTVSSETIGPEGDGSIISVKKTLFRDNNETNDEKMTKENFNISECDDNNNNYIAKSRNQKSCLNIEINKTLQDENQDSDEDKEKNVANLHTNLNKSEKRKRNSMRSNLTEITSSRKKSTNLNVQPSEYCSNGVSNDCNNNIWDKNTLKISSNIFEFSPDKKMNLQSYLDHQGHTINPGYNTLVKTNESSNKNNIVAICKIDKNHTKSFMKKEVKNNSLENLASMSKRSQQTSDNNLLECNRQKKIKQKKKTMRVHSLKNRTNLVSIEKEMEISKQAKVKSMGKKISKQTKVKSKVQKSKMKNNSKCKDLCNSSNVSIKQSSPRVMENIKNQSEKKVVDERNVEDSNEALSTHINENKYSSISDFGVAIGKYRLRKSHRTCYANAAEEKDERKSQMDVNDVYYLDVTEPNTPVKSDFAKTVVQTSKDKSEKDALYKENDKDDLLLKHVKEKLEQSLIPMSKDDSGILRYTKLNTDFKKTKSKSVENFSNKTNGRKRFRQTKNKNVEKKNEKKMEQKKTIAVVKQNKSKKSKINNNSMTGMNSKLLIDKSTFGKDGKNIHASLCDNVFVNVAEVPNSYTIDSSDESESERSVQLSEINKKLGNDVSHENECDQMKMNNSAQFLEISQKENVDSLELISGFSCSYCKQRLNSVLGIINKNKASKQNFLCLNCNENKKEFEAKKLKKDNIEMLEQVHEVSSTGTDAIVDQCNNNYEKEKKGIQSNKNISKKIGDHVIDNIGNDECKKSIPKELDNTQDSDEDMMELISINQAMNNNRLGDDFKPEKDSLDNNVGDKNVSEENNEQKEFINNEDVIIQNTDTQNVKDQEDLKKSEISENVSKFKVPLLPGALDSAVNIKKGEDKGSDLEKKQNHRTAVNGTPVVYNDKLKDLVTPQNAENLLKVTMEVVSKAPHKHRPAELLEEDVFINKPGKACKSLDTVMVTSSTDTTSENSCVDNISENKGITATKKLYEKRKTQKSDITKREEKDNAYWSSKQQQSKKGKNISDTDIYNSTDFFIRNISKEPNFWQPSIMSMVATAAKVESSMEHINLLEQFEENDNGCISASQMSNSEWTLNRTIRSMRQITSPVASVSTPSFDDLPSFLSSPCISPALSGITQIFDESAPHIVESTDCKLSEVEMFPGEICNRVETELPPNKESFTDLDDKDTSTKITCEPISLQCNLWTLPDVISLNNDPIEDIMADFFAKENMLHHIQDNLRVGADDLNTNVTDNDETQLCNTAAAEKARSTQIKSLKENINSEKDFSPKVSTTPTATTLKKKLHNKKQTNLAKKEDKASSLSSERTAFLAHLVSIPDYQKELPHNANQTVFGLFDEPKSTNNCCLPVTRNVRSTGNSSTDVSDFPCNVDLFQQGNSEAFFL